MDELTHTNAGDYLARRGWLGPGPFTVTELAGGVSNVVLRVQTPEGRLVVLKQSRPQLRTKEAWYSDVNRVFREQEIMRLLVPLLDPGDLPEVLFSDDANYAFVMTHAPLAARDWRTVLLEGTIDPALGRRAGLLLGRIHDVTYQRRATLTRLSERTVFEQLRVEPFYLKVMQRHPDLADVIKPLIERMRMATDALCHGDYSPKNLLLADGRFMLVDHETAHLGDPSMDLGLFLSHLLLKTCYHARRRGELFDLTRGFWAGYHDAAGLTTPWQSWSIAHTGLCLVARVDGTSPAPYLVGDEPRRDAVRRLGRRLLLDRIHTWDDVVSAADDEFQHLVNE
jgi:5-methylthioribose kinase